MDHCVQTFARNESVKAMIEQILFTAPGERLNRPTFGVGVQRLIFEPNGPFLVSRVRVALEENLYEHLGPDVRLYELGVSSDEAELHIRISFEVLTGVDGKQVMDFAVPLEGVR